MAEAPRSLLDSLAIRLLGSDGKHLGMATLISPTVALTSEQLVANHQEYFLSRFALNETARISASVIARNSKVGFAALSVMSPIGEGLPDFVLNSRVPPLKSRWESLYFSEDQLRRVVGEVVATTNGDARLQLSVSKSVDTFFVPYALGAPVIVDEDWLVGILSESRSESRSESQPSGCAAIPVGAMLESPEWKRVTEARLYDTRSTRPVRDDDPVHEETPDLASEEAPQPFSNAAEKRRPTKRRSPTPKFDLITFQQQLSSSSLTALTHASGIRRAQGQEKMHMEHLIAGLFQQSDGPTRAEFARAGIDWNKLTQIIAKEVKTTLPAENAYSLQGGPALSLLSKHVEQAFGAAVSLADANKSKDIRTGHLIRGALLIADCTLIKALIEERVKPERIPPDDSEIRPRRRTQAGIKSDDPEGEDLLDIKTEVEALCTVLASKDVKPPISLGLFGEWGSGKSFFMKKMEARFNELKDVARKGDSSYCANIVQLWFNAWHYMDTNLWASLATQIFEELAQELARQDALEKHIDDPDYERAQLVAQKANANEEVAKAEREKREADDKVRDTAQQLASIQSGETVVATSPQAVLREGYRFAVQQPEVRKAVEKAEDTLNKQVEEAARTLNIGRDATAVREQLLELQGLWVYVRAIALALGNNRNKRRLLLLLVTFLTVAAAIIWLLPMILAQGWIQATWVRVTGVGLALLAAVSPFIPALRKAFALIHSAIKSSQESIEKARLEAEKRLQLEHETLRQDASKAQTTLDQAVSKANKLTEDLDNLRSDRKMSNFIKQRHQSSDYTRYLGVIAKARNDFEQLSMLLANDQERYAREKEEQRKQEQQVAGANVDAQKAETEGPKSLLPRIDRIILYIDDLDRCPEKKVVDVLQAVHLLLAFPLFVVVVGVDPRWLLHSLRQHSTAFQNQTEEKDASEEERTHWQSTPLNYLEKIFQIPYTLWPMGESGFGKMVDTLTEPPKSETRDKKPETPLEVKTPQVAPPPATPPAGTEATSQVNVVEPPDAAPAQPAAATAVTEKQWHRRLLGSLKKLWPFRSAESGSQPVATQEAEAGTPPATAEAVVSETTPTQAQEAATKSSPTTEKQPISQPVTEKIDPHPEHLQIKPWEREYMKKLHQLIPSPRATKRFINVYRLIRAAVDIDERLALDEFTGDKNQGNYRAVLLLLAILTGYPDQATEILRDLIENKHKETWWEFVAAIRKRVEKRMVLPVKQSAPTHGQRIAAGAGARPTASMAATKTKASGSKPNGTGRQSEQKEETGGGSLSAAEAERWEQLLEKLELLRGVIGPDESCKDFVAWAPKVARYSFQSGRGCSHATRSRHKTNLSRQTAGGLQKTDVNESRRSDFVGRAFLPVPFRERRALATSRTD